MWREVSRPQLLRPPVFFFGSKKRFCGREVVISSKPGSDLNRSVGVSGRKFLSAILNQIDLLPFFQRHDRFLPMRFAPEVRPPFPFLFTGVVTGIHINYFLLKQLLDRLLDLNLVRSRTDAKNILILLLTEQRRLFRQRLRLDDV